MRNQTRGLRGIAHRAAAAVAVLMVFLPAEAVLSEGNPEDGLTQSAFNKIVETESSVEGQPATEPPVAIHNLGEEEEAEFVRSRGIKIIPGKDWKHETPEERDAHLRRIKSTMPPNSHLLITVPQGDVWLIGGEEKDPNYEPGDFPPDWRYQLLALGGAFRSWTDAQRAALPATVARDKKVSQSDKRGIGSDSMARADPEEQ